MEKPPVISTHNASLFGADFGQKASSDHAFLRTMAGQAATVNGARYRDVITRFFLPRLDDIDVADMWFQQEGAIQPMKRFNYRTRHFLVAYSLVSVIRIDRSCDLTLLDFFLWGYSK